MVELQMERSDSTEAMSDDDNRDTDAADAGNSNSNRVSQGMNPNKPDGAAVVKQVDVLRGREVIQHNSGTAGSLCFVVRRPG